MVNLGNYAGEVLSAYGVTILVLAVLIGLSVRKSRKARAALDAVERQNG
ncbi:heme exporter protein CcmD [Pelagovum pacificum]|uniref:Heme exporter protein D n=1 Tax=Pelagovum pacificum TaxID=2588711 RepID=A0A5C5GC99_9RHOB|nr:heme exporter protein CcmD [Pelagovum pacificum]QQA44451.1 heme exporter protein CcmD [Pelagovum pacificum]TNY32432.1 heme exporter protein CcmD [Pelagovum pacificum]